MKRLSGIRTEPLGTFVLLAVVVTSMSLFSVASDAVRQSVVNDLILLIAVVGYYLFVGNSGVLSFGHVAFMAVGGYVSGVLSLSPDDRATSLPGFPSGLNTAQFTPFTACLLGGVAAAIVAGLLAMPLMRLSGIAAALTSFAVLQIVYVFAAHADRITGGAGGLNGLPKKDGVLPPLLTALVVIAGALIYQCTRWGRLLRASREDPVAAASVGVHVQRQRALAFVLSGFVMGLAGGLYAEFLGSLTPDTLYLNITFMLVIMLVTGGERSLSGAVLGTVFVSVVNEVLNDVQDGFHVGSLHVKGPLGLPQVGLAVILLLILILRPAGLTQGREVSLRALARARGLVVGERFARLRR